MALSTSLTSPSRGSRVIYPAAAALFVAELVYAFLFSMIQSPITSLVIDNDLSSSPVPRLVVVTRPTLVLLAIEVASAGSSVGLSLSNTGYRSLIF